ncbi:helix-turn-helix domain-containing protein [Polycladidibacter hongkongensis]|uniref:helix-turn-helix domain-containing protein n=1 Tax=Polycladidibacter hongkongensis TaxID=1647556 RepID=UPI0008340703|nr:helix-turn-helix domain-containing protein [Pseudovibrio hongkongensis]
MQANQATSGFRKLKQESIQFSDLTADFTDLSRKKLLSIAHKAGIALALKPTPRAVLNTLSASWGEQLVQGALIVWPSNEWLCDRVGITDRALRNTLSKLIELGLIKAKDAPNRKRFPVRRGDQIVDAYGFDLTPMVAQANDYEAIINANASQEERQKQQWTALKALRIDTKEAAELLPQDSDLYQTFCEYEYNTPNRRQAGIDYALTLEHYASLKTRIFSYLKQKTSGSAGKNFRHIETNTELKYSVVTSGNRADCAITQFAGGQADACQSGFEELDGEKIDALPLSLTELERAIPVFEDFGGLTSWRDLPELAEMHRGALQLSEEGWRASVQLIGLERASLAFFAAYQIISDRANGGTAPPITSMGGYYRAYCRKIAAGEVDLMAELRKLYRKNIRKRG